MSGLLPPPRPTPHAGSDPRERPPRNAGAKAASERAASGTLPADDHQEGTLPPADALPAFAELHCRSCFTFLNGASHPEELVARALHLGYAALAITDECTLAGVVRAHVAARAAGLKLIIGSEFLLSEGDRIVLLARNREGYGQLGELITRARMRSPKGTYHLTRQDLMGGLPDCHLIILPAPQDSQDDWLAWARHFPGRCSLALRLSRRGMDAAWQTRLREFSQAAGLPLVASSGALMHVRNRKALHDVLAAIRHNTTVAQLGRRAEPNAERHLRSRERMAALHAPGELAESVRIADACQFSLDELRYEYPEELVPAGETPASHLRRLTLAGMERRYGPVAPEKVSRLVDKELGLIAELRYEAFFLTVEDVVREARKLGILCQGRGSAANSAVCFCLGITEVDPALSEVLFERFISRERNEAPDIDVDFEHQRREEVIQYIYAKYGRHRTALAATVICYRRKSALRDAGRALGLSLDQINRLTATLAWWDKASDMAPRLVEAGFDPANPVLAQVIEFTGRLRGFPRHLSQHVGGFVIAKDRLSRLVPTQNAAMEGRSVIEWDKDDLEALGLLKVDVLALGMLTALRLTFDALDDFNQRPRGSGLSLSRIPKEDPATYAMIRRADTVGVFQIESRAQMSMLPRLKPRCFYDLVIEVAIVRPGPIQGGMVHPYLQRRENPSLVSYPSEALKTVLERTLGVSIFQEQVMRIAEVAAGFTPGEADQLRRAMAAWKRKGGIGPFRERLVQGMRDRGYSLEFCDQIYRQIEGFGEYGFPESHAASFALLAYYSAWLKCHHPAAFTCGLLNAWPMGFYSPSQLIQDVRRHGVNVLPADVVASDWHSTLEPAVTARKAGMHGEGHGDSSPLTPGAGADTHQAVPDLRLGLRLISGLREDSAVRIMNARRLQPFSGIGDLAQRAQLDRRDLTCLASADALRSLSHDRRDAQWQALGLMPGTPLTPSRETDATQAALLPLSEGQEVLADYQSTGLTLRRHPLALLRPRLKRHVTAADLADIRDGSRVRTTGIVTCRQRPGTASGVVFVTLEDETGNINVVIWSQLVEAQRRELLSAQLLTVLGKLERKGEVIHVIAHRLIDDTALLGRLTVSSRDFH